MSDRADRGESPLDIVVVGQTPPPVHGQAVMVEALMGMREPGLRLHLVRLNFSRHLAEVGRLRAGKLIELVTVCRRIRRTQRETDAATLYVAIGGASLVPLIRDALMLWATRRRFARVILHVHGAGVGAVIERLPRPVRIAVQGLIGRPSVVVALTEHSPRDGEALRARSVVVIPNGIPELPGASSDRSPGAAIAILYVGTLRESKGVLALVRAVSTLRRRGLGVTCTLAGASSSETFSATLAALLVQEQLQDIVVMVGQLDESAKVEALARHDVFAFPSYYEGENQSVAMLEAMRAGLPIVAARWRGALSLVDPGVSGLLVPTRDEHALADAIAQLAADPATRVAMGTAAHQRFAADYTEATFHSRFAALFRQQGVEAGRA